MSTTRLSIAQIRAEYPQLTHNIRVNGDQLEDFSDRIGAIVRMATGNPDEMRPKDAETIFEMLQEELEMMETHIKTVQTEIHLAAFLIDNVPQKVFLDSATKAFIDS